MKYSKRLRGFSVALLGLVVSACTSSTSSSVSSSVVDHPDSFNTVEEKVESWLRIMTKEEKAGQMIQAERSANNGESGITASETTSYKIGSILNGGGNVPSDNSITGWRIMTQLYRQASLNSSTGIPVIYGVDAVHGHNNVKNSTIFPHNIGLAAANNPELMFDIGEVTAREVYLTGVNMTFAPSIGIIKDVRWGRTYETLGADPVVAGSLIAPYIDGLQTYNIAATAKHFIGDSYTTFGTGINGKLDQGDTQMSETEIRELLLPLYEEAVDAGVKSVMVSYSSIEGLKMHQNEYWITDVLKGELGFKGFVIGDYEAVSQVTGNTFTDKVINSVNAGVDMLMEPHRFIETRAAIVTGINSGRISDERIDDAVRRILTVKYELDLFTNVLRENATLREEASLAVARQAVRESQVLLKNENGTLPLAKDANILLLGPGADNIGIQSGGWTLWWQGGDTIDTEGTTLKEALEAVVVPQGGHVYTDYADAALADVVVLALAERPAAEFMADSYSLELTYDTGYPENATAITLAQESGLPTVAMLFSGKPLLVSDYITDWDAYMMSFLPGTEGLGMSDVLFGDYNFTGKLPYTYPLTLDQAGETHLDDGYNPNEYLYPYGHGLSYPAQ